MRLESIAALIIFALAAVFLTLALCWIANGDDDDYAC